MIETLLSLSQHDGGESVEALGTQIGLRNARHLNVDKILHLTKNSSSTLKEKIYIINYLFNYVFLLEIVCMPLSVPRRFQSSGSLLFDYTKLLR